MINYKVNQNFSVNLGFEVSYKEILAAVENLNEFLSSLTSANITNWGAIPASWR